MRPPPEQDKNETGPDAPEEESLDPLLVAAAKALEPTAPPGSPGGPPGLAGPPLPSAQPLSAGRLIAGRYRLDERLGEGGMGEVWAATHVITRRRVAMKFLRGRASIRADMRQRLLREARAASVVKHPSVVEVLDVFELEGGGPVLVMDLLVGETLGARLAAHGALAVNETATLLLPVVEAVEQAHAKGIVHRDLKPDNIFLNRGESGTVTVKLLDFGIAKLTAKEGDAADTGSLTGTGSVVGTPWYMAPEQCYDDPDIDPRADVWSLGVILYECLAGVRPVEGTGMGQFLKRMLHEGIVPIEERVPGIPHELAALIGRMLSHAREDRPRGLVEVRRTLSSLAGRSARGETSASHAVPGRSPSRSHGASRFPLLAFALVALAATGTGIVHAVSTDRSQRDASAVRVATASASGPIAAATSPPAVSVIETPLEVPSTASRVPSASALVPQPARLPARAPASQASALRRAPARPMIDPESPTPQSSAVAPASAQPPPPKTPEGRLFENVPF